MTVVPEYDQLSDQAFTATLKPSQLRDQWGRFIAQQLAASPGHYTFVLPIAFSGHFVPQLPSHRRRISWSTGRTGGPATLKLNTDEQVVASWLLEGLFEQYPPLMMLASKQRLSITFFSTIDQFRLNFSWTIPQLDLRQTLRPFLNRTA